MPRRAQLFVPSNNERMIMKSTTLKADSVILDLEDAVPNDDKAAARSLLLKLVPELDWNGKELCIRVNSPNTIYFYTDIDLVSKLDKVSCIVIPKAETDLGWIYKATGRAIEPIIESTKGLLKIEDIARSDGGSAISYGAADLALSMRADVSAVERNLYVKTLIVSVAHTYGIDPIDKVFFGVHDVDGFTKECMESKALGFSGKQTIHPDQADVAIKIFSPSAHDIEWAKRVADAYENASKSGKGVISVDGQMVDAVQYRLAKKILESSSTYQ